MPRYLTDKDIADFRAEICAGSPPKRFATHGYEGVTMRQLAEALGCSPKTPYRYFKDKARYPGHGARRGRSRSSPMRSRRPRPPRRQGSGDGGTSEAYLAFALKNPHA